MESIIRSYEAIVSDVDALSRSVVATINTDSVDRYKTVISPGGLNLAAYRKCPVVLWEHGKDPTRGSVPIGKNKWIKEYKNTLRAETIFRDDEYSRNLFDCYKEGILTGWSINVLPSRDDSSPPTKDELRARPELSDCQIIYRKGELAEYSGVAVPGNSETLTVLEERGIWVPRATSTDGGELSIAPAFGQVASDSESIPEEVPDPDALPRKKRKRGPKYTVVTANPLATAEPMQGDTNAGLFAHPETSMVEVAPRSRDLLGFTEACRYIRKKGEKWLVFSESGKVLGEHGSREDAQKQLAAIEANKDRTIAPWETKEVPAGTKSFEQIHSELLLQIRVEQEQIRDMIKATFDLLLRGQV